MLRFKYNIFFAQNKKPIKSIPCSIKNRLEVYVYELLWRTSLSSRRIGLDQNFFLAQIVSLKFQVFKSNLLQLSNYQRKRNKNLRKT